MRNVQKNGEVRKDALRSKDSNDARRVMALRGSSGLSYTLLWSSSLIHDASPRAGLAGLGIVSGVLGSSRSGRSWPRSSSSWARHHPLVLCSSCGAHPAMPTRSPTAHQAASSAVPVPAGFAASFASPAAAFAAQRIQLLFPPLVHLPLHHPSSWARASAVSASAPVWARKPSMSS